MDQTVTHMEEIARLGALLLRDQTMEAVLEKIVDIAVRTMPSASSVSVVLVRRGGYHTSHASSGEAVDLDRAQFEAASGPCLEAIARSERVLSAREADSDQWTEFCARADELGVHGSMSTPLIAGETTFGALNVYTRSRNDFTTTETAIALALAQQASVVVANTTTLAEASMLNSQLAEALASRDLIGTAKGLLMAREECTREEAFDILRRASQRENRRIRDMAEEIVSRAEGRYAPRVGWP